MVKHVDLSVFFHVALLLVSQGLKVRYKPGSQKLFDISIEMKGPPYWTLGSWKVKQAPYDLK